MIRLTNRLTLAATMLVLLVVYVRTIAPTLFVHDSAELAAGASTLGIVHAPGYPVYLLVAHALTYLPIGDVAYRVNLLSAISTVGAVGLLVWLFLQLDVPKLVASVTSLLFGFSFYVWSLSVVAEVYTFQVLLLGVLLCTVWEWRRTEDWRVLSVMMLVLGVAAANNLATTLWWGMLLPIVWQPVEKLKALFVPRTIAVVVIPFVIGLAFVLYLPFRSLANPPLNYAGHFDGSGVFHPLDLTQVSNIVWYMTGGPFKSLVGGYAPIGLIAEAQAMAVRLNAAFLGIGTPLGIWGCVTLWRKRPLWAATFLLTMTPHLIFFTVYRALDKDTMFLPVYFVWAIFIGVGLGEVVRRLPERTQGVILILPILFFVVNRGYIDVEQYINVRETAVARLESAETNSIYFGNWSDAAAMEYLQSAEGIRPDVLIINTFLIHPENQYRLISNALTDDRAVYTIHQNPALAQQFRHISRGHSFELALP